ncbi:hypothetical protein ACFL56_00020 [Candidatus Margulisiibacteriota bacterium]
MKNKKNIFVRFMMCEESHQSSVISHSQQSLSAVAVDSQEYMEKIGIIKVGNEW